MKRLPGISIGLLQAAVGVFYSWTAYLVWCEVSRWGEWDDVPISVLSVFGMLAISALVVAALLFARKGRTIRLVGIFLGSALTISVLGYALAGLDQSHVRHVAEGVEGLVWRLAIPDAVKRTLLGWPLFPIDIALRLMMASLLLVGDVVHRNRAIGILDVVCAAIALAYGSLVAHMVVRGYEYVYVLVLPPPYSLFFHGSSKVMGMRAFLAIGVGVVLLVRLYRARRSHSRVLA